MLRKRGVVVFRFETYIFLEWVGLLFFPLYLLQEDSKE